MYKKKVLIYTDGACSGNPGVGGWAGIIKYGDKEKQICGREENTTNNRMELLAAINSLKTLTEPCQVDIYSDSMYLKHGITNWIHTWKKNGWRCANKKPVKNVDLWQMLDVIVNGHQVSWHWVKGHGDDPINIMADKLAVKAMHIER